MEKVFNLLGFAQRAGKLISGEQGVKIAIHQDKLLCLLIAKDSSDNTRAKFLSLATKWGIPVYIFGNKERLGQAIGRSRRSVVGILDQSFSQVIQKELDELGITLWEKTRSDANEENKNI